LGVFLLLFVHYLLISQLGLERKSIDGAISLITQVIGSFLVLHSINSNIGIIKGDSLLGQFCSYIKDCPLHKKNAANEMKGEVIGTATGKATLVVMKNPHTTEGKFEYLQEQLDELKTKLNKNSQGINSRFDDEMKRVGDEIGTAKGLTNKVEARLGDIAVGGVKIQIFGVLLFLYGPITSF